MTDCEALAALRTAVSGARAIDGGRPFGVYIDDRAARQLLEHCAHLDAVAADLRIRLALTIVERDRARAIVAALIEGEPN